VSIEVVPDPERPRDDCGEQLKETPLPPRQPFCDIAARHKAYLAELREAAAQVLSSGNYVSGGRVKELETELCGFTGAQHAFACANGTVALELSLRALGIVPGDGVIVPAYTFIASAGAVSNVGAVPIFADVDRRTLNLSAATIEQALGLARQRPTHQAKPRAIIAVNIFGSPCEYNELREVAGKHKLKIIEDGAQSFGATYRGARSGTLGDVSACSFFPAKPLGGLADGGAVFCADGDVARQVRLLANHGYDPQEAEHTFVGTNARLGELQAALLSVALRHFPAQAERREEIARMYRSGLQEHFDLQDQPQGSTSAHAQFAVVVRGDNPEQKRQELINRLARLGIEGRQYYTKPLHLQRAFSTLGYQRGDLPIYEDLCRRVFNVPNDPFSVTPDQVARIIAALV
jgi:UDP-2-acetamido-2-deoxy-ribo-hexuluronate aminotransferase